MAVPFYTIGTASEPGTNTAEYDSFPAMCANHAGDLIMHFRTDVNTHSLADGGNIAQRIYSNGTWGSETLVVEAGANRDSRDIGLLKLADADKILLTSCESPDTAHDSTNTVRAFRSDDDGDTWTQVGSIDYSGEGDDWALAACSPIQLSSGRILTALYVNDSTLTNANIEIYRSDDNGATWAHHVQVAHGDNDGRDWVEPSLVIKSDGTLLCFIREEGNEFTWYSEGSADGLTWTTPISAFSSSGAPRVIRTSTNQILIAGRSAPSKEYLWIYYCDESDIAGGWRKIQVRETAGSNILNYGHFAENADGIYCVWSEGQSSTDSDLYFAEVQPTDYTYNRLLGLGTYSEDADTELVMQMQDDAASTAVDDTSSNDRNGTLAGAGNTSASTTTGPNGYLAKALSFDGTDDRVGSIGAVADFSYVQNNKVFGFGFWVKFDDANGRYFLLGNTLSSAEKGFFLVFENGVSVGTQAIRLVLAKGMSGATNAIYDVRSPDNSITDTNWHHIAIRHTRIFIDGVMQDLTSRTSSGGSSSGDSTRVLNAAHSNWSSVTSPLDGSMAGLIAFSKDLVYGEIQEHYTGPEPEAVTAPTVSGTEEVGSTLTVTAGTYDLPAPFAGLTNGTIAKAYQWYRADDALGANEAAVSGATSLTYTLVAADEGKFLRCKETPSNDGGTDPEEIQYTGYTGEIAAGGGAVSGSVSATLGGVTASAAAESTIDGSVTATLDGVTASVTAASPVSAGVTATLDGATASATAESTIEATVTATLDGVTASASVESTITAGVTATLDGVTVTSTGSVGDTVSGSLTATLDGVTGTATGESTVTAGVTATLEGAVASIVAESTIAAGVTAVLDGVTVSSTADTGASAGDIAILQLSDGSIFLASLA